MKKMAMTRAPPNKATIKTKQEAKEATEKFIGFSIIVILFYYYFLYSIFLIAFFSSCSPIQWLFFSSSSTEAGTIAS
jgi:hypothetical protein